MAKRVTVMLSKKGITHLSKEQENDMTSLDV